MTKLSVVVFFLCLTCSSFVNASSFVLNDYNLITIGDVNSNSLHVHGNAFIGGNLDANNVDIGNDISNSNVLELAGQLKKNIKILGHNNTAQVSGIVTGQFDQNGVKSNTLTVDSHTISNGAGVTQNETLSDKLVTIKKSLSDAANDFSELDDKNSVDRNDNKLNVNSLDDNGFAVFELGTKDRNGNNSYLLSNQNKDLEIIYNLSNDTLNDLGGVIINVPGTNVDFSKNNNKVSANYFLSTTEGRAKVLWNFFEATTIKLNANFYGSILAPLALLTSSSDIDGSVAVYGLTEQHSGQIHLPTPELSAPSSGADAIKVPEPSSIALFIGALFFILRKKNNLLSC